MCDDADQKTAVTALDPSASASPGELLNTGAPRNGKVAKLSKDLRDLINQMLSEGATSAIIIEKLAGRGVSLNHQNVSNWRHGGYQDWVAEQEWLAQINAERETAADLLASGDETSFHQAVLQLALTQIFQTLRREQLRSDPVNYTRLLNALSRIAREALVTKKYRDAAARENAAELIHRDPKRKLNDDERRAIVRNVDEILGLRSEAFPPRAIEGQNGASRSASLSAPTGAKEELPSTNQTPPPADHRPTTTETLNSEL